MRCSMLAVVVAFVLIVVSSATASRSRWTAWKWYYSPATQCEVSHEGGWTSFGDGSHAGRFQMDYSFETETAFGRAAERRWGRAYNWPHWAQVKHAFEVWLYAGWHRWPPYYVYCYGLYPEHP